MNKQIKIHKEKIINSNLASSKLKQKKQAYDYMIKVIVIGDSGVGKTNIISRFCGKEDEMGDFKDYHVATIGVDFSVKFIKVQDKNIKMQIWDTAGQQRFRTITQSYYKGAAGIILVYSVQNEESFRNIQRWIEQINSKSYEQVKKILVANKIDLLQDRQEYPLQHRFITRQEGRQMAKKHNMQYCEVSAKLNEGIVSMFEQFGGIIKKQIQHLQIINGQDNHPDKTFSINSCHNKYRTKRDVGIAYSVEAGKQSMQKFKEKICSC